MLVIIAGSRHFDCMATLEKAIADSGFKITRVLSGHCRRGMDRTGERWAQRKGVNAELFPADWESFGSAAGPERNERMARVADALIALPCQCSRGTRDMIGRARKHGLAIHIVEVDCGR